MAVATVRPGPDGAVVIGFTDRHGQTTRRRLGSLREGAGWLESMLRDDLLTPLFRAPSVPARRDRPMPMPVRSPLLATALVLSSTALTAALPSGAAAAPPALPPASVQVAEYELGRSLVQRRMPAAALAVLGRIAAAGPQHVRHAATLPWLGRLARELPEPAPLIEAIGSYTPADLDRPELAADRDHLLLLMGRHHEGLGTAEPAPRPRQPGLAPLPARPAAGRGGPRPRQPPRPRRRRPQGRAPPHRRPHPLPGPGQAAA
jgi:hypothetical protein